MDEETIKNELQKFNVTDAVIARLNADYMALAVKDANDDKGYEVVKRARIDIKKRRVEVEKTRVMLKAESLEYGRRVDGEAKRITALLEPIETHLIGQEKVVDDEKARIKAEADAKEAARIQVRIDTLCAFGTVFDGQMYVSYGLRIPAALVKACTNEEFAQFVAQVQEKKDTEDARLKAEADARKAEADRLAKVAADQEAERIRLAETARQQAEERNRLNAEQKKIDDARQKVIDDAKRAEEIEKARTEAAEKAKLETEARIKREAEEKIEKERLAKIAAEKKAARAPDKVKLLAYAVYIAGVAPPPELKTAEAKSILMEAEIGLSNIIVTIREKAEAL